MSQKNNSCSSASPSSGQFPNEIWSATTISSKSSQPCNRTKSSHKEGRLLINSTMSVTRGVTHASTPSVSASAFHIPPQRSPRRKMELVGLDLEMQYLNQAEKDLLATVNHKRRPEEGDAMSESDYSRRRDELNRRLRKDEKEIQEIIQERDQARKDKQNVESAYSDVQEKYERVLKTIISLKEKEDLLLERDNENVMKVEQMDRDLEQYKESARKQVESEYQNWLSKLEEAEATNMRLKAMIRKADMKVEKLEHELGQKDKENDQLHNLCDDLINNSSRKSSIQEPF